MIQQIHTFKSIASIAKAALHKLPGKSSHQEWADCRLKVYIFTLCVIWAADDYCHFGVKTKIVSQMIFYCMRVKAKQLESQLEWAIAKMSLKKVLHFCLFLSLWPLSRFNLWHWLRLVIHLIKCCSFLFLYSKIYVAWLISINFSVSYRGSTFFNYREFHLPHCIVCSSLFLWLR